MKSRRWLAGLAVLWAACLWLSEAHAQAPSVIYTWDHGFGEALGPHNEVWVQDGGGNTLTLDNITDGVLTLTETGATAGSDWAIRDDWNRVKESFNGEDYGGLDLLGLDSLEIDIGHNGPNPVSGQVFGHLSSGYNFTVIGPITVNPGPVQTYSIPLSGLTPLQISAMPTIGIQIFDHAGDGNLTWQLEEVRSAGAGLDERLIANHDDGGGDLDGAIVNFDEGSIVGHSAGQNSTGLTISSSGGVNSLQWDETAGGPGAGISWGDGDNLNGLGVFAARPLDASNYKYADVRVRVASSVPNEDVSVQYYLQTRDYGFYVAGAQTIPADGLYHELTFSLAGIPYLGEVQWHGIEFGPHTGSTRYRVDYVNYRVPEPAGAVMLLIGLVALFLQQRKQR